MASLTIHNLDEAVARHLREQAAAHARSIESEAAAILARSLTECAPTTLVEANEADLKVRREVVAKFLSGEWAAEMAGFEAGRAADRAAARSRAEAHTT